MTRSTTARSMSQPHAIRPPSKRPTHRRMHLRSLMACVLAMFFSCGMRALAHPDRIEDRLLSHFATGVRPFENGTWSDLTGHISARLQGEPVLTNVGPAQAVLLNGF